MSRSTDKIKAVALETERFRLVPIHPRSLVLPTWHWTRDSEAFANLGWRSTGWTKRRWWRHLRHQIKGSRQCHGIWLKSSGQCIGLHILNASPAARSVLIGVFIGERDWWGKGVVEEVRRSVIDDCFERMNMERIWAQVHVRNLASVFNHRKLGFTHEGTLRSAEVGQDGTRMDVLIFGMLRSEWLESRGGGVTDDG